MTFAMRGADLTALNSMTKYFVILLLHTGRYDRFTPPPRRRTYSPRDSS